jgi:hypothetical protein
MSTLGTIVVFAVVLAGLVVGVWALFEMSPFAKHQDQFRDPVTGKRTSPGPRLD